MNDPYYVLPGPLVVDVVELVPEIDVQAFEMTDTTFKYRCNCKKGFHLHGNGGDFPTESSLARATAPNSTVR